MGFVHNEDFDSPDFDIDDIATCSDVRQLFGWLEATDELIDDLKAQVEAAKLCENFDPAWMERIRSSLGFQGMGKSRLKKRLKALGVNPEPPAYPDELGVAQKKLADTQANLVKARSSAEFGRNLLEAVRAHVSPSTFDVIVSAAAVRAVAEVRDLAA